MFFLMRFQWHNVAKITKKLSKSVTPGGVQRTNFSLLEPLLGAPWRPRGPQSAPGEAQRPAKDQQRAKIYLKSTQHYEK